MTGMASFYHAMRGGFAVAHFESGPGRAQPYLWLLAAVLGARALAWPISLIDPDEYAFILSAREVLHGHLPYTTFFDIKPVGSSLLLALAMAAGGVHLITVRIFGALCVYATALCLYEIMRALAARSVAVIGAPLLYIAFSVLFGGLATMTEIMLAPFSALGVLLMVRWLTASPRARAALAGSAGLAFGAAIAIKMVPVLPAACVAISVALLGWRWLKSDPARLIRDTLLFGLGLALPTGAAAALFLQQGVFGEWAFSNFGFMHLYIQKAPPLVSITKLLTVLVTMWPLTLLVAAGAAAAFRFGLVNRTLAAMAYAWLAGECAAAIMPMHMYGHYFLMTLPPLSILASLAVERAGRFVLPMIQEKAGAAAFAALALVPLLPVTWSNTVTLIGRTDPQRQVAQVLRQRDGGKPPSLLVLSYDFMADYLFTNSPLPARIAIPLHLFGPEAKLAKTVGGDPLADVLARDPNYILMDRTVAYQDVTMEEKMQVEAKLACCYAEVARMPQFWAVEPGTYHMRDTVLFARKGPEEASRRAGEPAKSLTLASARSN